MPFVINYRSNVEEISAVANQILEVFEKFDLSIDGYLNEVLGIIRENTDKMFESLNEEVVKSSLSPLDAIRDKSARVIFLETKAKLLWPDDNIVEAAQVVMDMLNKYGMEVINLSYSDESRCIDEMLTDFEDEKVKDAYGKLHGFSTLIEQLKKDQKVFNTAFEEYNARKNEKKNLLSASKIAALIREQINKELTTYLEVMNKIKPDIYNKCFESIKSIILENNKIVKIRVKSINESKL